MTFLRTFFSSVTLFVLITDFFTLLIVLVAVAALIFFFSMASNDSNNESQSTSTETEDTNQSRPKIESYAVKLPHFWIDLPECWFVQAESQFRTSRIVLEQTKFDYIVQALPSEAVKAVYDVILRCQQVDNPYSTLKTALIQRYTMSDAQRIEKLLDGTEMGDRRPSDFYNSLKLLAGDSAAVNAQLLLSIWSRRLPPLVQLTVQGKTDLSTEALLASADAAFEVCKRQSMSLFEVTGPGKTVQGCDSSFQHLEKRLIDVIEKKFSQLETGGYRSRSRSRSRSRGRSESSDDDGECYYHRRFGDKARKCRKPCSRDTSSGK